MGQIECKNCSTGTYVPEKDHPGKSAADCRACPYGKYYGFMLICLDIMPSVIAKIELKYTSPDSLKLW